MTNIESQKQMIQEAKQEKKDLVFAFVKGLGNAGKTIFE
jgi:hypothetical protein